jgi:hypothetical protein
MSEYFKSLYLAGFEKPENLNVIQRIITGRKQPKDTEKKVTPLPADSANLIKATLLGFVADNCSKFDVVYEKNILTDKKGMNFIRMFRFPFATYLTSEMFGCISYFMSAM